MKDIPLFTSAFGAASLVLREVPYQKAAYVHLQATQEPEKLLEECVRFCRMVGAERIYATGHPCLERFPLYSANLRLKRPLEGLGDTDGLLFPVQAHTAEEFRRIYNEKVSRVPNAAWMDGRDMQEMLNAGEGYFVHRDGMLLGIGRVLGGEIRFLASVQPGAGETVVKALSHAITGDTVTVEVSSANEKAMRLYQRLGFIRIQELRKWFDVTP